MLGVLCIPFLEQLWAHFVMNQTTTGRLTISFTFFYHLSSELDEEDNENTINCEEEEEEFHPAVRNPDALATCQHAGDVLLV